MIRISSQAFEASSNDLYVVYFKGFKVETNSKRKILLCYGIKKLL